MVGYYPTIKNTCVLKTYQYFCSENRHFVPKVFGLNFSNHWFWGSKLLVIRKDTVHQDFHRFLNALGIKSLSASYLHSKTLLILVVPLKNPIGTSHLYSSIFQPKKSVIFKDIDTFTFPFPIPSMYLFTLIFTIQKSKLAPKRPRVSSRLCVYRATTKSHHWCSATNSEPGIWI